MILLAVREMGLQFIVDFVGQLNRSIVSQSREVLTGQHYISPESFAFQCVHDVVDKRTKLCLELQNSSKQTGIWMRCVLRRRSPGNRFGSISQIVSSYGESLKQMGQSLKERRRLIVIFCFSSVICVNGPPIQQIFYSSHYIADEM